MWKPKNRRFSPQIIHFNRVFHYFHHPFWGVFKSPYFWVDTQIFVGHQISAKRSAFHGFIFTRFAGQPKKNCSAKIWEKGMVGFFVCFFGEDSPQVFEKGFFLGGWCWNVLFSLECIYIPGPFAKCFRVNRSMVGLSEQTACSKTGLRVDGFGYVASVASLYPYSIFSYFLYTKSDLLNLS